jgi:hypothetical protein
MGRGAERLVTPSAQGCMQEATWHNLSYNPEPPNKGHRTRRGTLGHPRPQLHFAIVAGFNTWQDIMSTTTPRSFAALGDPFKIWDW